MVRIIRAGALAERGETTAAVVGEQLVAAEVVGDIEVLVAVAVVVEMGECLGPPGVAGTGVDLFEAKGRPTAVDVEPVWHAVLRVGCDPGRGAVEIVAEVADVEIEQAVAIDVDRGRRATDVALALETGRGGDVMESSVSIVDQEPVAVTRVGDEEVGVGVVVEVGQQGHSGFPVQDHTGLFGDVSKTASAVVDERPAAPPAADHEVVPTVAVEVCRRDTATGKGRRDVTEASEVCDPVARCVAKIEAQLLGDVGEDRAGARRVWWSVDRAGLTPGARGHCLARVSQMGGANVGSELVGGVPATQSKDEQGIGVDSLRQQTGGGVLHRQRACGLGHLCPRQETERFPGDAGIEQRRQVPRLQTRRRRLGKEDDFTVAVLGAG